MSAVAERPHPRVGEQVDLLVSVAGELVLPEEVLDRLHLEPGDLVALEPGSHSVRLDPHRELLASVSENLDDESAWRLVEGYLDQPLTSRRRPAADPRGGLAARGRGPLRPPDRRPWAHARDLPLPGDGRCLRRRRSRSIGSEPPSGS